MSKRDYYDVLGIDKGSSAEEIKKAYKKKARQYHPDISKEADAEEKFKEVNEAYETLSDPQKKAGYDQFGHAGAQGGFGGGGGFGGFEGFSSGGGGFGGFDDILNSFFGGGRRGGASNGPRKGRDIEKIMNISFEEAVFGMKKTVNLPVDEKCDSCNGTGAETPRDVHTCSTCNGSGTVIKQQQSIFGMQQVQTTCPKCGGRGKTISKKCKSCSGKGTKRTKKDIEITVPPGVDNGTSLRMEGYGEAGPNGGPNGDMYVVFRVADHPHFERDNTDVYLEVPISFSQAALGDRLQIPTLYGDVDLKIPSGIQSGMKLRLKDKGIPDVRTKRKGDQYIIVDVQTPKKLSKEEQKLFESLLRVQKNNENNIFDKFKKKFKK